MKHTLCYPYYALLTIRFIDMTKEELNKKIAIEENISEMNFAILTKHHLNELGKNKELCELKATDFRGSLFSTQDFQKSHIVIFFDERGVRCLKRRYTIEDTDVYMQHLGFSDWTF